MKTKIKKLLLSLVLAVVAVVAVPQLFAVEAEAATFSGTCGSNLTWKLDTSTGLLQISGTGAMTDYFQGSAPWYYYLDAIENVEIGNSITSIGEYAFYNCIYLESVTIGNNVKLIGRNAFGECTELTNVTIGKNVASIGTNAFRNCTRLKIITIPNSVTSIGAYAFRDCISLKEITIPDSLTSIGTEAFDNTSYYNNESNWDSGVLYIGKFLICSDSNVVSGRYTVKSDTLLIADYAFYDCTGLTSITIPDSVTSIDDHAFSGCTSLTSITIPDSVTSIGDYAFSGCTSLTSITIPDSVTSIGSSAFRGCTGLTSITIPDSVTSIGSSAFNGCTGLTSITIPDSVTSIDDHAFSGCTSLTSITIPDSVTSIGDYAFYNCSGINELTMPASAKIYDSSYTFYGCSNIEKVTLTKGTGTMQNYRKDSSSATDTYYGYTPWYTSRSNIKEIVIADGVTNIGNYTLYFCTGLTSITIPASVTNIGNYAFYGCTGLLNIYVDTNNEYYSNDFYGVLFNKNKTKLVQYPSSNLNTSYTIPNSVISINEFAFYDCTNLTSVIIPDTVTSIGKSAFMGCNNINDVYYTGDIASWCAIISFNSTPLIYANNFYINGKLVAGELVIPYSVTSIGNYSFYGCANLTSVTIPDSVTSIGNYSFYGCANLTSVTIPDSITSIGNYSFYGCANLTSVTIPDSITSIGNYAFSGCVGLANITIPNSVTTIGDSAFYGCSGITELILPVSAKIYNSSRTFGGCSNIQKVTLTAGTGIMPNYGTSTSTSSSVTNYKFTPWYISRNSIRELIIEDGVKNIGAYAFCNCIGLESLIIPNSVTNIGAYALCDCIGLESLIIPNSVTNISGGAFQGMTNLESLTLPFIGKSRDAIAYEAVLGFVFGYETYSATTGMFSLNSSTDFKNSAVGSSEYTWQYTCCNNEGKNSRYFRQSYYYYIPDSLKTVTVTDATIVNTAAFMNCINLVKISLNDNLTTIDGYAFYKCTGLTSITIPKSVTGIGTFAFSNCSELTTVFFAGTEEEWNTIGYNNWSDPKPTVFFNHAEHLAGEWETKIPATCISEGLSIKKCAICQEVLDSQTIPQKNEHEYIEKITTYPTCTTAGMKTFTCVCGDSYTEVLPATGHSLRRVSVAPTCTEEGKICYQCQNCLAEFNVTVVPTTGHSYKEEIVSAPTCTAEGKTKYTCHCGDSYTVTTPMLEHDTVRYYTAPTCLEPGMEYYLCNSCGNMIGDMEIIPETGHIYGWAVVEAPTATESGSKKQVCTGCGEETAVVETIPATGFEATNGMVVDYADGIVYGLDAGIDSLDGYTNFIFDGYEWIYDEGQYGFGTGTVATLKNGDEIIAEYTVVVFGDVDGNGWYDANDAFIVNMIVNGLLPQENLPDYMRTAADCNHDGEINELDFDLLINASVLLDDVDQSATQPELATQSAYIEYMSIIDQSVSLEVEDTAPETDKTVESAEPAEDFDFGSFLAKLFLFIRQIFNLVFSFAIK